MFTGQFHMKEAFLPPGWRWTEDPTINQSQGQLVGWPHQPSGGQLAAPQGSSTTAQQSSLLMSPLGFQSGLSTKDGSQGMHAVPRSLTHPRVRGRIPMRKCRSQKDITTFTSGRAMRPPSLGPPMHPFSMPMNARTCVRSSQAFNGVLGSPPMLQEQQQRQQLQAQQRLQLQQQPAQQLHPDKQGSPHDHSLLEAMQPQMSVLQAQHLGILPQHMQGPTPAMFQPNSSGGPDSALLFKEGHLIRNGAFPAQVTSQQQSVVGGSLSGKSQPAQNGVPEPTQQPPSNQQPQQQQWHRQPAQAGNMSSIYAASFGTADASAGSETLRREPGKKKTVGGLVKEVEAQSAEGPGETGSEISDNLDDSLGEPPVCQQTMFTGQFHMKEAFFLAPGWRSTEVPTIDQSQGQLDEWPHQPSGGQLAAPQGSSSTAQQSSLLMSSLGFQSGLSTKDGSQGVLSIPCSLSHPRVRGQIPMQNCRSRKDITTFTSRRAMMPPSLGPPSHPFSMPMNAKTCVRSSQGRPIENRAANHSLMSKAFNGVLGNPPMLQEQQQRQQLQAQQRLQLQQQPAQQLHPDKQGSPHDHSLLEAMQPQMSVLQAQHLGILPQYMQGPTPAMFQPKSSGGLDGAFLFKEGHLIRNGAFPAQVTSDQQSVVGGCVSGKGQPAHNGMPKPTQQPPSNQQPQQQQWHRQLARAGNMCSIYAASSGSADASVGSETLQTEPGKKKTVGDLVKEVEAQSTEGPDESGRKMSDNLDDYVVEPPVCQQTFTGQFHMKEAFFLAPGRRGTKVSTIDQSQGQLDGWPHQPSGGQLAAPQGSSTTAQQSSLLMSSLGFQSGLSTKDGSQVPCSLSHPRVRRRIPMRNCHSRKDITTFTSGRAMRPPSLGPPMHPFSMPMNARTCVRSSEERPIENQAANRSRMSKAFKGVLGSPPMLQEQQQRQQLQAQQLLLPQQRLQLQQHPAQQLHPDKQGSPHDHSLLEAMQPQLNVLQVQHLGILPQHMQGPTPAMFQPKSSGGPDGALLFKEGHLIWNGAFLAQCTSQQQSLVGDSVSGKGQPAHNGMPEPTQQPPSNQQPQQQQLHQQPARAGNLSSIYAASSGSADASAESETLQTKPGKKKTVGDLVKEVEAHCAEGPDDSGSEMSDNLDDSLLGLRDSFNILEYVDADQDRAFVGEGGKGKFLDKSLELDVEEGVLEEVGCLETDSKDGDPTQGPIPALFQPKSSGGPDGALLFKEGHLIRNGAFRAQCTSQQQSVVGGSLSEEGQPAHNGMPEPTQQPPSNQQPQQQQLHQQPARAGNLSSIYAASPGTADASAGSEMLRTEPGKKKTVGDLVKEVEAQSAEGPNESGSEMSDNLDDSLVGLGDSFDILEYVDADQDRAFVGEGEKGNLLNKSLELDVKDGDLEEVRCLKTDSRDGDRTEGWAGKQKPLVKRPPVAGMSIPGPAMGGALSRLPRGYWPLSLQEQLLPYEDLGKGKKEQRKHSGEAAMESLLSNVDLSGSRSTCSRGPPDESIKTPVALLHAMPQQHPVNPGQLVGNPSQHHHQVKCGPAAWPTSAMVVGAAQASEQQLKSQLPTRSEEPMVSPGGTMHLVRTKQGAMRVMGHAPLRRLPDHLGQGGDQVRQHRPGHPYLQCSGDGTHPIMRLISEFGPPPKATTCRIRSLDPSR
ncbi:uncharacterized protein LOC142814638 isoform X2 [Rhipicephalus microplus]|uniref:uncharacterized protein LOC142814638 isoform X2 n=1 Tax=Rhipicephalus microplus TaxID=6941 RepID=UPI003F6AC910